MITSLRVGTALTAVALLSACGGSGHSDQPPTAAEADSAAKAIQLTADDLPGFKGTTHTDDSDSDADDKAFASCIGASAPTADSIKDTFSDDFSKGSGVMSTEVSSEVDVVKSSKTAAADAQAYQGSKVTPCLETFVSKALADSAGDSSGVTFGKPQVSKVDVSADGVDSAFGYKVALTAKAQGQSIPFEVVLVGLLKKHTKVSFTSMSVGTGMTASERDRLMGVLRGRTKKSAV